MEPALAVSDLNVEILGENGAFPVVSEMSLSVNPGETVCIVGESGCGKSMTALSLMRLLPESARVASGSIKIHGEDFLAMDQRKMEDLRGDKIAMIFQEPLTALNPVPDDRRTDCRDPSASTASRAGARPLREPSNAANWCRCRTPSAAPANIRTNFRAACGSGR